MLLSAWMLQVERCDGFTPILAQQRNPRAGDYGHSARDIGTVEDVRGW